MDHDSRWELARILLEWIKLLCSLENDKKGWLTVSFKLWYLFPSPFSCTANDLEWEVKKFLNYVDFILVQDTGGNWRLLIPRLLCQARLANWLRHVQTTHDTAPDQRSIIWDCCWHGAARNPHWLVHLLGRTHCMTRIGEICTRGT